MKFNDKCGECDLCEKSFNKYLETGIYEPIRCSVMGWMVHFEHLPEEMKNGE